MTELLEFIEDLKGIQALPEPMQPAAVDRAVDKYTKRFEEHEQDMARQMELNLVQTILN
tara:strand:+ start:1003 stop:1179 length:177 start_codon:yes stop_codon:yes gene_type:complete